jgi:HEPN domain-containing protein
MRYDPDMEEILGSGGLDKYYIPTRYPNGLPGGVPYEAYDEDDAKKAIGMAARVVEYVGSAIEEIQG